MSSRKSFVALLALGVLVLAFVAYEAAGLVLNGWHTISFYSQQQPVLFFAIFALFPVAAVGLMAWWWWHIKRGRVPK